MRNIIVIILVGIACLCSMKTPVSGQHVLNGTVREIDEPQQQAPAAEEQKKPTSEKYDILTASKSNLAELQADKYYRHYVNIDGALRKKINQELHEHGLNSGPAVTKYDLDAGEYAYLLTYRIETLDFGFKTPFGRHTKLKVSYVFQRTEGSPVISGDFEEHSKKGWKNCVQKISRNIAAEVSDALAGKIDPGRQQGKMQQASQDKIDKGVEERLQQLDYLRSKGLVTEEEYRKKRDAILEEI